MTENNSIPCPWHTKSFTERSLFVVATGKEVLGPTSLTNGRDISGIDMQAINTFFDVIAPNPKTNPELANYDQAGGLKEHCHFSGEIAYRLAVEVNSKTGSEINPHAEKAALYLHDLGRTANHSFMETDQLTDIYWSQIGIRKDLKDMTHSAHLYWDDVELDFETLSYPVRISVISDVLGKRSSHDSTRLRHKEEVLETVKKAKEKYLKKTNLSLYEKELVHKLPSYTKKEQYTISGCLEWLNSLNIDINAIVDEVMQEYQKTKETVK